MSMEHVILALPLAAWLVTPRPERRRAALTASAVAVAALSAIAKLDASTEDTAP